MLPHMHEIAFNISWKMLSLEGPGVLQNSTLFYRDFCQKTMLVHKGDGVSKISNMPSTWFINAPYMILIQHALHFSIDFFQIRQIIGKQSRLTVKKVTMRNHQHELDSSTNSNISTTRYDLRLNNIQVSYLYFIILFSF